MLVSHGGQGREVTGQWAGSEEGLLSSPSSVRSRKRCPSSNASDTRPQGNVASVSPVSSRGNIIRYTAALNLRDVSYYFTL